MFINYSAFGASCFGAFGALGFLAGFVSAFGASTGASVACSGAGAASTGVSAFASSCFGASFFCLVFLHCSYMVCLICFLIKK